MLVQQRLAQALPPEERPLALPTPLREVAQGRGGLPSVHLTQLVQDTGGAVLGRVQAVHNHGAGDLLEVAGPGLKAPLLLPFTLAVVPTVDLAAGRIVADLPEGLE